MEQEITVQKCQDMFEGVNSEIFRIDIDTDTEKSSKLYIIQQEK